MSFTLISAPVYKRDWLLPTWFAAIERQDVPMHDIGFQFLTGPRDLGTLHVLLDFHRRHPEVRCFDLILDKDEEHVEHVEGHRSWPRDRYRIMAKFRNKLLDRAIARRPDYFFSLDTDIILEDPETISQLMDFVRHGNRIDAVSPLTYMTPEGTSFPNVMTWFADRERAFRKPDYPIGTLFQSDIIMAAVMMSPEMYTQGRYEYHVQGEDVGWSKNAFIQSLDLYSASGIYTPHIMSQKALATYLESGDLRGQSTEVKAEGWTVPLEIHRGEH